MKSYRKKYHNILENKNHLTVVSRAHNTIESLENQAQDAFSVERTPRQYYMQRMGQLHILSLGRGRYNLKYYQKQDNLAFPAKRRVFETEEEMQESFIILPKTKRKNMIQVPTFFRIYPIVRKFNYFEPEQSDSITFNKSPRTDLKLQNENNFLIERKKQLDYYIESINDIKIKSEGKFFHNKPVLKKKSNLEVEYLVIKAPFKPSNETKITFEHQPKKIKYKEIIQKENKIDIYYNMNKPKIFPLEDINISNNENIYFLHNKPKTSFKEMIIDNTINIDLIKKHREKTFNQMSIEDMPDIFIQETPGKRYVSVGMERMSFIGNLRPEFCLEIDPNEEIFIPNVYDMLLLQNYWDDLEIKSFGICLRPIGYRSKKKLIVENEVINESKESNGSGSKEDLKKIEEKNEEIKEENNSRKNSLKESKEEDKSKEVKKKKFKPFDLKKTVFKKK